MSATRDLQIVCFSANDWDDIPSSKFHIMNYLGQHNDVLFIDTIGIRRPTISTRDMRRVWTKGRSIAGGIRQVGPRIHVLSPPALPFHGSSIASAVNQRVVAAAVERAMRKLKFVNPVAWSYLPHALPIIQGIKRSRVVYHCIDDFSSMTGAPATAIADLERETCLEADLVAASAEALLRRCMGYGAREPVYVPHAVNREFAGLADAHPELPDIDQLPRPLAGFLGRLGDWIDVEMIANAARALPHWSFPIVGPTIVNTQLFDDIPNVHLLGQKSYDAVPAYLNRFDVAVIPYRGSVNQETRNPLKLYEYLALGKPVVTTSVQEARRFADLVDVVVDSNLAAAIVNAKQNDTESLRERRRAAVGGRSWGDVAEEIVAALRERAAEL
jgi:glycosyltransferase involved in cell wall biosynthesis